MVPLKQHSTQLKITLEILKQCSSNLAPAMTITNETSCHCHDHSYAAGSVLITAKKPKFYFKQGSSTPTNLMGIVKTIWESCEYRTRPSGPLLKVANGNIWFFTERDRSQECCHGNNKIGGQCKYLQNGKRYAKKENAIFSYSLFNYFLLHSHFNSLLSWKCSLRDTSGSPERAR